MEAKDPVSATEKKFGRTNAFFLDKFDKDPDQSTTTHCIDSFVTSLDRSYLSTNSYTIHLDSYIKNIPFEKYFLQLKKRPISFYEKVLNEIINQKLRYELENVCLKDFSVSHILNNADWSVYSCSLSEREKIRTTAHNLAQSDGLFREKYELFKNFINLVSGLLVKLNIFTVSKYRHRDAEILQSIKILNSIVFDNQFINYDILWLCLAIRENPLKALCYPRLQQYSEILELQFNYLISDFLEPSVVYSARIVPNSPTNARKTKIFKKLNVSMLSKVFCCLNGQNSFQLLSDFELAYRLFEKEIIGMFYTNAIKASKI